MTNSHNTGNSVSGNPFLSDAPHTSDGTEHFHIETFSHPAFSPHPIFRTGWTQTIAAALLPPNTPKLRVLRHALTLPDNEQTILSEVVGLFSENAKTDLPKAKLHTRTRTFLLVHGLTGNENSPYIQRLAALLFQAGYRPFLMNLRGCGPAEGLSQTIYHSGRSEDTRAAIHCISKLYPSAPITQIGFSLGGNITLKMAGEDGASPAGNLDSCIAVSAPLDLNASAEKLQRSENLFFDQFFVQLLRLDVWKRHRKFPRLGSAKLPLLLTLKGFDDIYTSRHGGFKDGTDYYTRCSSGQFVPSIRIPTLLICAKDDPIVETRDYESLPTRQHISIFTPDRGGHVGFLGEPPGPRSGPQVWHDQVILKWVKRLPQT